MIDEKRLDEIANYARNDEWNLSDDKETKELIQLARLGLWVHKYGIIALNVMKDCDNCPYCNRLAREALAALPKEE